MIGRLKRLSEVQETDAPELEPVESNKGIGTDGVPPLAAFQLGSGTTPATSEAVIATPAPTNWMLMTFAPPLDAVVTLRVSAAV